MKKMCYPYGYYITLFSLVGFLLMHFYLLELAVTTGREGDIWKIGGSLILAVASQAILMMRFRRETSARTISGRNFGLLSYEVWPETIPADSQSHPDGSNR